MTTLTQFERIKAALEEAEKLIGDLNKQAIDRGGYDNAMVALETANNDLEIIRDARLDPVFSGHLITEALVEIRREIDELNKARKP